MKRAEFSTHGLHNVDVQHRNVCREGFGNQEGVEAGESVAKAKACGNAESSIPRSSRSLGSDPVCEKSATGSSVSRQKVLIADRHD